MKEIEVKLDVSGKPLDWDGIMSLDELTNEIVNPRLEAAKQYAHRFERDAMETALRFGCRAVYVVEWSETHDFKDEMKWGTRYDICWKCFPYECRRDAFRLCKEKDGHVRIIDFKGVIEMPCDIFCRIDNPNRDLAEQIREKFKWTRWK